MLDLSSTHYQLSNAPSLVPVLKAVLHNFTKELNQVWWYRLDPVVTSLQSQLSQNPEDKIFLRSDLSSTHHWLSNAPSLVSVRATELSMSQNILLWCIRTSHIALDWRQVIALAANGIYGMSWWVVEWEDDDNVDAANVVSFCSLFGVDGGFFMRFCVPLWHPEVPAFFVQFEGPACALSRTSK